MRKLNKITRHYEEVSEDYFDVRKYSSKLFEMIDKGLINPEKLAKELISWLSEDDVKEFVNFYDYFDIEDMGESLKEDMNNLKRLIDNPNRRKLNGINSMISLEPVMADAYIDSEDANDEVNKELKPVKDLIKKDGPTFGAKNQPKPKKIEVPKSTLDESLFEELETFTDGDNFNSDFYNAVVNVVYKYKDKKISEHDLDLAYDWFITHFFDSDDFIDESLLEDKNKEVIKITYKSKNGNINSFLTDAPNEELAIKEFKNYYNSIPVKNIISVKKVADSSFDSKVKGGLGSYYHKNIEHSLNEENGVNYSVQDLMTNPDISPEERRKVFDSIPDDRVNYKKMSKFDKILFQLTPDNISNARFHTEDGAFKEYVWKDRYFNPIKDIEITMDDDWENDGKTYIKVYGDTEDRLNFAKIVAEYFDVPYEVREPSNVNSRYSLIMKLENSDL